MGKIRLVNTINHKLQQQIDQITHVPTKTGKCECGKYDWLYMVDKNDYRCYDCVEEYVLSEDEND